MSNGLRAIVEQLDALPAGRRAVLATVVDVSGSSYRLPGARMLIDADGTTYGMVSGGCLDADLVERARRVTRSGEAQVVTYDTRATDDTVFGLNLGCRGVVRILLEPAEQQLVEFLRQQATARRGAVLATLVAGGRQRLGTRLLADDGGVVRSGFDAEASQAIAAECAAALEAERSKLCSLECGEVFVEYLAPPMPLVVFGAGPDAVPLVRFAEELGWRVTLVDHRPAMAARPEFAAADEVIVSRPETVAVRVAIDARTAAVVMTHNYSHDLELLGVLLASEARYVGVLGPKARTNRLLDELARGGRGADERDRERLYAPVGVDIGAESPEEIALSIVAEIRAVSRHRRGGLLRERDEAIHDRRDASADAGDPAEPAPRPVRPDVQLAGFESITGASRIPESACVVGGRRER